MFGVWGWFGDPGNGLEGGAVGDQGERPGGGRVSLGGGMNRWRIWVVGAE